MMILTESLQAFGLAPDLSECKHIHPSYALQEQHIDEIVFLGFIGKHKLSVPLYTNVAGEKF